jgi:hypothetical protein
LEYYIHDGPAALQFELAGSLSGQGAESVHYAWQTALSIIGDRALIFDITSVIDADQRGRDLLLMWQRQGARIIARSSQSRALAAAAVAAA